MKKVLSIVLAAALMCGFLQLPLYAAPGDGGAEPVIVVTPSEAHIAVGETLQLQAEILPPGDPETRIQWLGLDKAILWEINPRGEAITEEMNRKIEEGMDSGEAVLEALHAFAEMVAQLALEAVASAPGIATVDENGLVTGVGDGHLFIVAVAGDDVDIAALSGEGSTSANMCDLTVGEPEDLPDLPEIPDWPERGEVDWTDIIAEILVRGVLKEFFRPLTDAILYYDEDDVIAEWFDRIEDGIIRVIKTAFWPLEAAGAVLQAVTGVNPIEQLMNWITQMLVQFFFDFLESFCHSE